MQTRDIRRRFLEYFKRHDHEIVASSPLVPANDPTLLFTNAGMVQFKDVFLGLEQRPYRRAVTAQRCVRAGGKHNDLENVGYTARHHTFFEMLGNFSFGDYFKRDAVRYAWELLTEGFGLPEDKLWVTVFEDDDEAADIWLSEIGVEPSRFARIGAHDNFWAMGDTGPCGPCSEIFYDHGPTVAGGPPGSPDADGDRYVEIWNLVFMQFNRGGDGSMQPLPKPSVDTGMGLERLAAVLQGVHSNYETDLFRHLIAAAAAVLGVPDDPHDKSLRVLADHIRSSAFLITDGVTPSNEGRGYVLRRIVRRAIRHGYRIGGTQPFFHRLVAALVEQMGEAYPELEQAREHVERVLRHEGERFAETLDQGLRILDHEIGHLQGETIPGDVVFRLYDTYGFPTDLTADVAREHGLELDMEGFEQAMREQRSRARAASQFGAVDKLTVRVDAPSEFTGYAETARHSELLAIAVDSVQVDRIAAGQEAVLVLDRTPFYAESGGQVGDRGRITCADGVFDVTDTQKLPNGVIGHIGRLRLGELSRGAEVSAEVDAGARAATANNHSATHLLHAALRRVLGRHVQQKGSLVAPERLRFDFAHHEPVTPQQLGEIEKLVNEAIRANYAVETRVMDLEEARAAGAEALFGEKYDARVRVVGMGEFSLELCGGTHVARTGDIGLLKIVAETGIAAGVRRIEALTAQGALDHLAAQGELLDRIAALLRVGRGEIEERVAQLAARSRQLEKDVQELQARLATAGSTSVDEQIREVAGVRVLVSRQGSADVKALRTMVDRLRNKVGSGVVVVGAVREGKVTVIAGVTQDRTDVVHAGKLVQHVAAQVGGKGGGRADMAQGGGVDPAALDTALESVYEWVERAAAAC